MAGKKRKKKIRIKVINPLRAEKYGENHRRNQVITVDADIAKKAIEAGDAVEK